MNLLDLLIVLSLVSASIGGYRLGFLARVTSWAGLGFGLFIGVHFLPQVASYFKNSQPSVKVLAAIAFLLAAGMLGQGLGLALGAALHASLAVGPGLRQYDRFAGGALGAIGVLTIFWLLAPSLGVVPGWTSRAARGSVILGLLAEDFPKPPDTLASLRRLLANGGVDVFEGFNQAPNAGVPPADSGLSPAVYQRVLASTVKVSGQACQKVQEGSGWVASPGFVVTNAHVVAGETSTTVLDPNGKEHDATVVAFDPNRDIAILRVPTLTEAPLTMRKGSEGMRGAVFGHPGGQVPIAVAPAQISQEVTAVGRDIYDATRTRRDVYILASHLAPGDSGGALVDQAGDAVGVAFAIAPDNPNTAYALTNAEVTPVLQSVASGPVNTGPCLV